MHKNAMLKLAVSQGFDPWPAQRTVKAPPTTPLADGERKLNDLFRLWAEQKLSEAPKEVSYATPEEVQDFNAHVRHAMAQELVSVRKFIRVQRKDKDLGELYTVRVRAGMQELYKLRYHPAFRRITACAGCVARAKEAEKPAPLSCRHRTPLQKFINRTYESLLMKPDTRKLMYVLLVLREAVEHYLFYGFNPLVEEPVLDKREREPQRHGFTLEREVWADDDTRTSVEYVEVKPSDSTSRLHADLQSWDRPSSFSKNSQRLAFCGACGEKGDNPWFWVARKRVDGGYERAPFALTHFCPRCKALETTPTLAPRTAFQFVPRKFRRHGVKGIEYHLFYRSRGRWVSGATHEVCSTQLSQRLQLRWLSLPR
jgi:hypothetical protein